MLDNPIFVVGTGRCGSTMFHDVLSRHRHLGWLSQLVESRLREPRWNRLAMQHLDTPLVGRYLKRRLYPAEPYGFWERFCHGFSRPYRDITADDVIPRTVPILRRALGDAIPEEKRLLAKITGWPRIGFLKAIFPDARFVHIVRDGRAVVSSVLAAPYFDGWSGPSQWTRGDLDERQMRAWKASGESFVILAAIGWENRMKAFEEARAMIPAEDYLEIHYEAFCQNKMEVLEHTLDFLGLSDSPYTPAFRKAVSGIHIESQNDKWKTDLSEAQQTMLDEYLRPLLIRRDRVA